MNKPERKNINKMTKSELAFELDNLRTDYDRMELMQEIMVMVGRMVTTIDLRKIRDYTEKVYNESVVSEWGCLHGMRDNIVDMANNLAELRSIDGLQYYNTFMYGTLLNSEPEAVEGLYTMTDGMKSALLERLQESKKGGDAA